MANGLYRDSQSGAETKARAIPIAPNQGGDIKNEIAMEKGKTE